MTTALIVLALLLIQFPDPRRLGLIYGRLAWLHMGSTVAALLGIGWAVRLPG